MVDVVPGLLVVKLSVAVDCNVHFKIINNKAKIIELLLHYELIAKQNAKLPRLVR